MSLGFQHTEFMMSGNYCKKHGAMATKKALFLIDPDQEPFPIDAQQKKGDYFEVKFDNVRFESEPPPPPISDEEAKAVIDSFIGKHRRKR
jgi:hypothetical protein